MPGPGPLLLLSVTDGAAVAEEAAPTTPIFTGVPRPLRKKYPPRIPARFSSLGFRPITVIHAGQEQAAECEVDGWVPFAEIVASVLRIGARMAAWARGILARRGAVAGSFTQSLKATARLDARARSASTQNASKLGASAGYILSARLESRLTAKLDATPSLAVAGKANCFTRSFSYLAAESDDDDLVMALLKLPSDHELAPLDKPRRAIVES